ncbi:MAG: cation:proton antiporter [Anaerolineae bacterium]|nr:cation:proton antiporter [Anaerolineae bacterium]
MTHSFSLFATITMAILTAFIGGYIARRLGLPALVGYVLAGLVIGPFTPGFVGDAAAISQLAEMGVVFMMFGVGLHFSLRDLWSVRRIAIPGAALTMITATLAGLALTQLWGWTVAAGLVLGFSLSIASTVVLLRGLSDNGLLNTPHGKVAVGWLVLEDLATVAILVIMPALVGDSENLVESMALALFKTGLFVAAMLFIGGRVMPWILAQIAHSRSREVFILAVVGLALGTAFIAYELFGVSLALAAFLAGVVVSESDVSHQVGAEVIPFRDVFAVLFFVSVGMLVNPASVIANAGQVFVLILFIVAGKSVFTVLLGFLLPGSERTMIVVAAGLSQIGEFSFIVGQAGVALGILNRDQYGLILAGSVISILINPLMYRAIPATERFLQRFPALWRRMERGGPTPEPLTEKIREHVIVVGYGRVGKHIARVLDHLGVPYLVVEQDAAYATEIQRAGVQTLLGDAANSEILRHVGLEHACALVVTVPNQTTAELIVAAAHDLAPELPIIARAGAESGVQRLAALGARHVIHPELEGGLEIVRHTLLILDFPTAQIQTYIDAVRSDTYTGILPDADKPRLLDQLVHATRGVEIGWYTVGANSSVVSQSLLEANIRSRIGASIIAIVRGHETMPNPKSNTRFQAGDLIGLIGTAHELEEAARLLDPSGDSDGARR